MNKPFYEHDEIVYKAVEKIDTVLNQYGIEKKIEYNNNRVDISYSCPNGGFEIIILDYSEEEIDEMTDEAGNNMFVNQDECITIDLWRNDMKVCQFYGNWLNLFLDIIHKTLAE